jgi:hypothetical protein
MIPPLTLEWRRLITQPWPILLQELQKKPIHDYSVVQSDRYLETSTYATYTLISHLDRVLPSAFLPPYNIVASESDDATIKI